MFTEPGNRVQKLHQQNDMKIVLNIKWMWPHLRDEILETQILSQDGTHYQTDTRTWEQSPFLYNAGIVKNVTTIISSSLLQIGDMTYTVWFLLGIMSKVYISVFNTKLMYYYWIIFSSFIRRCILISFLCFLSHGFHLYLINQ